MKGFREIVLILGLACVSVAARAQEAPPAAPVSPAAAPEQPGLWLSVGGTSTTLRGDCQEDCVAHGTGAYIQTGSVKGILGYRVNPHMDAGIEVSWVPTDTQAGETVRSTFLLATSQFRPWPSRGLFLNAGMGMAWVRNFSFDSPDPIPDVTSKALGLTYGVGWDFRQSKRLGFQIFAAQHMAAMGDFQTAGTLIENVVVNYWSVGGAIVIR